MELKQISIFTENKPGKLYETMEFIAQKGINVRALSVADSQSYGIIRIIVDDVEKVADALMQSGYVVKITSVLSIRVPNETGVFAKVINVLAQANINIEYAYAYTDKEQAQFIIRVDDNKKALEAINQSGLKI